MRTVFLLPLLGSCVLAQQTYTAAASMDEVIEDAVRKDHIPGAVLLVGQPGRVLYYRAYGSRALAPAREAMTKDTIFDAASLTKVVATTSAMMKLVEEGKVRLADKVTVYLPRFQGGRSEITVRHLLTHFSGFRPDLDLDPAWSGYETGINRALVDKPIAAAGDRFIYSDINFILLGEIARVVSGRPLDVYTRDEIFRPLGMDETQFRPPAALAPRIAPTELVHGQVLRGIVHDETARYMGGVAGHAGLFTTATDLAKFADMLLGLGQRNATRIVSPLTVQKFTEPNSPPHQAVLRGLGWDIDSPYSTNRGELFPVGSYGHTGFTGTSMWIDPSTQTYVILLTNSVHPHRRPAITSLRGRVATIAAASVGIAAPGVSLTGQFEVAGEGVRRPSSRTAPVLTGLDVLVEQKFAALKSSRVGLITNHTGLTRDGRRNIDAMLDAGVRLTALFSPEHGIAGREDHENVQNSKDEKTGLPIWSLYRGENRKPSEAMLREVDTLVFDIQDIGARYYTYISTMKSALEAASAARKTLVVLDRPNPIGGIRVEGPLLDSDLISFVGCYPMPVRHGMTVGELASFLNGEAHMGAKLEVIPMKNWQRGDWWDTGGLTWVDPSPNMRSLAAALLYPAVAWLEYSKNYSVGRGTDAPFEEVGADWIRGPELADYLNRRFVPGVRFYATRFRPTASYFANQSIEGVRIVVTDRENLSTLRLGLELGAALERLYPGKVPWEANLRLIGSRAVVERLKKGEDPRAIELDEIAALRSFLEVRRKYLLYR